MRYSLNTKDPLKKIGKTFLGELIIASFWGTVIWLKNMGVKKLLPEVEFSIWLWVITGIIYLFIAWGELK